jgi:transcriptional regulator with XRE-family HTH domain
VTLLRTHIGSSLRAARVEQGRTLRDVAKAARVSLGYLSEVERGHKEASSELLNSICAALHLSLSSVLHSVSLAIATTETPVLTVISSSSEVNSEVEAA